MSFIVLHFVSMSKIIVFIVLFSSFFMISSLSRAEETTDTAWLIPEKADYSVLKNTGTVQVSQIINPLTIRLNDNRIIQLTGINIPDLTPYDSGDIAVAVQEQLEKLLNGKKAILYQTTKTDKGRSNRMGYQLAHIETSAAQPADGENVQNLWIQGFLLMNGLVRARPNPRNPEMAAQMYALEQIARAKKIGLWDPEKYPAYQILPTGSTEIPRNSFAIVEGTVKSAAQIKNTTYLNFGNNWRDDFTIGIESAVRRQILKEKPDMNLQALGGKNIRVRGWVEDYNGAFIRLEHPSLIEFLPDDAEATNLGND